MSTINTTINHGVILGQPGYYTPLTITSTGAVNNNGTGKAIFGGGETVVNYGRITATGNSGGYGYQAVYLGGGYVNNHGTITADGSAVLLQAAGTVVNSGFIYGQRWGVTSRGLVTVANTGTISGGSQGIVLSGGGVITNSGLIAGGDGIGISGAAGTVVNSGSISSYGAAVYLFEGGTAVNTGTGLISTDGLYAGVMVAGGAGSVINSGTIDGYLGVEFAGTYNDTLIDSGTIIGSGGAAVLFGSGNDLMQFQPGTALVAGSVDGGGGTNTLEFAAGGGTLIGQGADFVDFSQGTVDAGSQWSIGGNVTLGAGIDLTISGNLSVAGTLENAGSISPIGYLEIAAGGYLRNDASGTIVNHSERPRFDPTVYAPGGGDVTIVNLGAIEDPAGNASIYLVDGGTVVNGSATDTSALISGEQGIYAYLDPTTVTNFGSIIGFGSGGIGIALIAGGVVTNGAAGSTSAVVSGAGYGIFMPQGTGTVVNFGTISSARYGIDMAGGTVVDAGLIAGGSEAIDFGGGGGGDLLVLENGFTLTGGIVASGTGNVVELQGNAGAPVAATYNALGLSGFQTAAFAPGDSNYATWTITNDAALPGTVAGFTGIHDAIDLTTLSDVGNDATTSFNATTDVLTVTGDNGSVQLQLDSEDYAGNAWTAQNDGSNGIEVTPLCFCAGTAIATPGGEVPVEHLAVGDLVLTLSGRARAIAWIGAGRVLATRGRRNAATPVIVRKGALGADVPHRDLHVTKAHSLYLDGVLIPVEFLVNHRSILWDDHAQEVMLYHIELETHDVLMANGAPAESYRDDGNRWLFQNANTGWNQPPKPPCAEVVTGGPVVEALWRRLLDRAGPRAGQVLTGDSDLHLMVDGCRLNATRRVGSAAIFTLPAGARSVRIASRAAAPAELGLARDPRVLGIALRCIAVRSGSRFRIIGVSDDRLVEGFHGHETDGDRRWTNGDALLPADLFKDFAGGIELVLHVEGATRYRADDRSDRNAA
ncbi:MAG TPA: Hint domain-containing protein [Rhodopila sp.]|nr:Hint domain-containing protein [Rhodopila sp.]